MHDGRDVPERGVHERDGGDVYGGPVPQRGDVRAGDGVSDADEQDQRDDVQRRERLHAERQLSGRRLHRREPGHVHRAGPVPCRGDVQPVDGRLLGEHARDERDHVQRWEQLHLE